MTWVVAGLALAASAAPSQATFHLWAIKEIFSSADGAVQFIEFFTRSGSQQFVNAHNLTATSDGNVQNFSFPADLPVVLPETTANRHFLIATDGFGALAGGVTPDYTIPANFFNPNATSITINFSSGADVLSIAGSLLPKNGVDSLTDSDTTPFNGPDFLSAGVNSPTNFAGVSGSVNVSPPPLAGDFTDDGAVDAADFARWTTGFGTASGAAHAQGDADADGDVDGGDFTVWQRQLGLGSTAGASSTSGGVPEPATGLLAPAAMACWLMFRARFARGIMACANA